MKLTNEQINALINELVVFEPALKSREGELSEMIARLAEARPEINFDESFRVRLRAEIMELAKVRAAAGSESHRDKFNLKYMFNLNKISYAAAGAAILILIVVPAVMLLQTSDLPVGGKKIAFETKINQVTANAFGDLRSAADGATAPMVARPQGGGGGAETMSAGSASGIVRPLGMGGGGDLAVNDSAKIGIMPPSDLKNYRFVYRGTELAVPAEKLDVLKQVKGAEVSVNMSDLIQGLNFGLADIGTFSNLSLQNISLVQKGENGYIISVMPEEGAISISQNWMAWPQAKCGNDAVCYENQRVRAEDIPSDEELIGIADAFLAEHNIDKSVFGEPQVSPGYNFRIMYEASADKTSFYFPESIEVTYPVKVDGKFVYDEWNGIKQGMSVSVQVKQKKVSNLYNLTTQNYQASAYEMETDVKKLLAYAEQGGMGSIQYGVEVKTEELELGEPELVYTKYYNYKDNAGEELLVPALYFPIKESPKDQNFFRKGVIVPLAKSVLAERQAAAVIDSPGGSGASGSTGTGTAPAGEPSAAPTPEPFIESKESR